MGRRLAWGRGAGHRPRGGGTCGAAGPCEHLSPVPVGECVQVRWSLRSVGTSGLSSAGGWMPPTGVPERRAGSGPGAAGLWGPRREPMGAGAVGPTGVGGAGGQQAVGWAAGASFGVWEPRPDAPGRLVFAGPSPSPPLGGAEAPTPGCQNGPLTVRGPQDCPRTAPGLPWRSLYWYLN